MVAKICMAAEFTKVEISLGIAPDYVKCEKKRHRIGFISFGNV